MSAKWFEVLSSKIPSLKHHFLSLTPPPAPSVVTPDERKMLLGRSMTVRRLKIFPIEAIVRGYVTGSAWAEYKKTQTIHGLPQAAGLLHCQKLPHAIYTPSTKAELGEKDMNITPDQAREIVGEKYASRIEELVLACYKVGAEYAEERGIVIVSLLTFFYFCPHDLAMASKQVLFFVRNTNNGISRRQIRSLRLV